MKGAIYDAHPAHAEHGVEPIAPIEDIPDRERHASGKPWHTYEASTLRSQVPGAVHN